MSIILQPAGDRDSTKHYVDTVLNPVNISRMAPYVNSSELTNIKNNKDYIFSAIT